eukprot:4145781-Amphidinium_carterae.1
MPSFGCVEDMCCLQLSDKAPTDVEAPTLACRQRSTAAWPVVVSHVYKALFSNPLTLVNTFSARLRVERWSRTCVAVCARG